MNFLDAIHWEERQNSAIASEIATTNVQSLPGKLELQPPRSFSQCLVSVKDQGSEFGLIQIEGEA